MKSTFAQILERHIRRAGISVTRLASQAQLPKQTLFNWCDGRMPRWHAGLPTELARLARALGLNTQESEELLQAAGCVCAVDTPRFEDGESGVWKMPHGWIRAGSEPAAYDMGVDPQVRCQQAVAATLHSRGPSTGGFGTLMQMCSPADYRDERVRFSAQTRTEDVVDWAGLWMRVDGERGEAPLGFDNTQAGSSWRRRRARRRQGPELCTPRDGAAPTPKLAGTRAHSLRFFTERQDCGVGSPG